MKKKILYFILLLTIFIPVYSQIQIGNDINGDAFNDFSGSSLSLSSDGRVLAIAAPFSDENGVNSGQVKIFKNNSGNWEKLGDNLVGKNPRNYFGQTLSLSSDGNILAVSATLSGIGNVQVYENNSGIWTQIGDNIKGVNGNQFGESLSLSSDGSIIAIGAPGSNNYNSGQVRVFKNDLGTWTQIGQSINGENEQDNLGINLSLSSGGDILAIGIPFKDENGDNSGQVKVFKNNGGTWTQIGDNINGSSEGDEFGRGIDLSKDGDIIVVGAPFNDENGENSGQVTVFKNNAEKWEKIGNKLNGDKSLDSFGYVVSLSSQGSILAAGAPFSNEKGDGSGQVKVFKNNSGTWDQLGNNLYGDKSYDQLGKSLSLSSDGDIIAIGSPYNDENASNSGQVQVYSLSTTLSLNNVNKENSFNIYINNVRTKLKLKTKLNFKKATIYNYVGKLISESQSKNINITYLPNGVYFVKIKTSIGTLVKRFVK